MADPGSSPPEPPAGPPGPKLPPDPGQPSSTLKTLWLAAGIAIVVLLAALSLFIAGL